MWRDLRERDGSGACRYHVTRKYAVGDGAFLEERDESDWASARGRKAYGWPMPTVAELLRAYRQRLDAQRLLTEHASGVVRRVLKNRAIQFVEVTHRTKEPNSLRKKLQRGRKQPFATARSKYSSLDDIPDLSGVRVVIFDGRDLETTQNAICEALTDVSIKSTSGPAEQLGYSSLHVTGDIKTELPLRGRIEVQIRTVLQHAWAMLSHRVAYKKEDQVPSDLKRRLLLLAGLLEVGGDLWTDVLRIQEDYQNRIAEAIEQGQFKHPVNDLTVDLLMRSSFYQRTLEIIASKYDFRLSREGEHDECVGMLSVACRSLRISGLNEIVDEISKSSARRDEFLRRFERHEGALTFCAYSVTALILWRCLGQRINGLELKELLKEHGFEDDFFPMVDHLCTSEEGELEELVDGIRYDAELDELDELDHDVDWQ